MISWDDILTVEEKQRVKEFKRKERQAEGYISVRLLAQLGDYYGWQAIRDVLDNRINPILALNLLQEAKRLERERVATQHVTLFNSIACAFSKHGDRKINDIVKRVRKGK